MHVTRTIPAVLTATALVLTSCSSTEGGIGAPAALETNGDEVIQDADGTGVEVSQRFFESSETVVVSAKAVSYTHLRAHETRHDLVCRLLLEKKNKTPA